MKCTATPRKAPLRLFGIICLAIAATACAPDTEDVGEADEREPGAERLVDGGALERVMHVAARDYAFDAPDTVTAGWTTIVMANEGREEHFMYLYRLPGDKSFENFRTEFYEPFGAVWNAYASGELSRSAAEERFVAELPGWFFTDVVPAGGPALTEPGRDATVTILLEPGTYVVECYVKTPDGQWHTELGMQHELTVVAGADDPGDGSDDDAGSGSVEGADAAPTPGATLVLTNYEISGPDSLAPGSHVFEVRVEDRPEGFMPHDINLFRLDGEGDSGDVTVDRIVEWMDWMKLDEFRAPAPGVSLGGMEHLGPGSVGYVHVELQPGEYAWVSEGYGSRGMTRRFVVP